MCKKRDLEELYDRTNKLTLDSQRTSQTVSTLSETVEKFITEATKERDGLMETNHKLDTYKNSQENFESKVTEYMEGNDTKLGDIAKVNNKFQKIIYISGSFIIAVVALGALMSWVSEMRPLAKDLVSPVVVNNGSASSNQFSLREQMEFHQLKLKFAKEKFYNEQRKLSSSIGEKQ